MTREAWKNTRKQYELIYIASWRSTSTAFIWSQVERISTLMYKGHREPNKELRLFFTIHFKSGTSEDIEFPCSREYEEVKCRFLGIGYTKKIEKDIDEYWLSDDAVKAKKVRTKYLDNFFAMERKTNND